MPFEWYVIQSKPNHEEALCAQLLSRGIEVYFPKIRVKPANPRARKIKAYFPGYLFIRADLDQTGLSLIEFTPFAKNLVSFGHEPAPVPQALLDAIHRRVDEVNAAGGQAPPAPHPGDSVYIQDGPFAGYTAIFDAAIPGRERVRVLIQILSKRYLPVELTSNSLRAK
jgi:transcription antitermination factor NusG